MISFQDLGEATPWTVDALCAQTNPDQFFPDKGESSVDAKTVCASCPVIAECLAYAVKHRIHHGVWGGTSPNQRQRIITAEGLCVRCGGPRTGRRYCGDCAVIVRRETKRTYEQRKANQPPPSAGLPRKEAA